MHAAQSGFMNAWAAATYLVQRGVPSGLAHERIGKAVQMCLERGCELQDLSLQELAIAESSLRQEFLRIAETHVRAGDSRCSRWHRAESGAAGNQRYQEENCVSSRGGPCARVKQSCRMQSRFTS